MRMRRLLAAGTLLALVGCGGDDEPPAEPTAPAEAPAASEAASEEAPSDRPAREENGDGRTYTVEQGDTLTAIAERFDVNVRALAEANDINDPDSIAVGTELAIPRR